MRVLAYCDQRYLAATRKVVGRGAKIVSSPPLSAHDVGPGFLEGYDVIYLDLHGEPGSGYLYSYASYHPLAALSFQTVQRAKLEGVVVVATTCHLPETPFAYAFQDAGAVLVGGSGRNWGTRRRLSGAQVLAKHIIDGLRRGYRVEKALELAKRKLRYSLRRLYDRKSTMDALAFRQLEEV